MQRLLIMWLEGEDPALLFPIVSQSERSVYASLLPEEMQCMIFGSANQAKPQGKPFSSEDNKNVLDGNELTQYCALVCVLLSFSHLLTSWWACTVYGKNKHVSYRSSLISISLVISSCQQQQHQTNMRGSVHSRTGIKDDRKWYSKIFYVFLLEFFFGLLETEGDTMQ